MRHPGAVTLGGILFFCMLLLLPAPSAQGAPLPKGKTIAVLVQGVPAHAASARAIFLRALLDGGYKAVDEKQLERIRASKAAALALDGNVEAILKLGRTYGFAVLISARITVPPAVKNEFGLFTATATAAVSACTASNGRQILAGTESAKEIGYTAEEAAQKAAEGAARRVSAVLLGQSPAAGSGAAAVKYTLSVSPVRSLAEAHGLAESCREAGASEAAILRFSGGKAEIEVSYGGSLRQFLSLLLQKRSDLSEETTAGNSVQLSKN